MQTDTYKIPVLVTLDSGEEEIRNFEVEAFSMNKAIELAKARALEEDGAVEAVAQIG